MANELNIEDHDKIFMTPLSRCMAKAKDDGYTQEFRVEKGMLTTLSGESSYRPESVKVKNFYRFEGDSDPGDEAILYLIETDDHVKGVLVNAFGVYADGAADTFIKQVEEINKKPTDKSKS